MRRKIDVTEGIFPMPVLMIATYNEDGTVDVMNAAWGTMLSNDEVILNLTKTHKTVQNIYKEKLLQLVLRIVTMLKKLTFLRWYRGIMNQINLRKVI